MKTPEEIGMAILARLARQAETNRQAGAATRERIYAIANEHQGKTRLSAKIIQARYLKRFPDLPIPSTRSIYDHMRAKNAQSSASRSDER